MAICAQRLVAASALLGCVSVLAPVALAKHQPSNDLPRWDFWTPAIGGARFTGQYLSSAPGGIHQKRQSFEPIDLFELRDSDSSINKLLYGSVLLDPIFFSDVTTNRAVQAAFEAAVASIKAHADVSVSPEIKVTQATVFPLKVTGDNDTVDAKGQRYRFTSQVTFGFNFYLTLEDAELNISTLGIQWPA
uniref:RxLR effector candidate protein n=1 Tax=Hyaloperonospora arabidopsidis (strain Emoy2) TaxID=559515 RepID=M4BRT6_HYAAE